MFFQPPFKKTVSLILIFCLLGIQIPHRAEAQIQDEALIAQYKDLLIRVTAQAPLFTAFQELDNETLIQEFQRDARDTPETRELLDRLLAFSEDPRQVDPYLQQLHEWGKKTDQSKKSIAYWSSFGGLYEVVGTLGGFAFALMFGLRVGMFGASPTFFPTIDSPDGCPYNSEYPCNSAYSYFTSEALMRYWVIETTIPLTLGYSIGVIRKTLSAYEKMKTSWLIQWQDQLFNDLKQATGIPALREISGALASTLDKPETGLTEVVVENPNWGEGTFLPAS